MKVLVIDVGGSHIKALVSDHRTPVLVDSGPDMTAKRMVAEVRQAIAHRGWQFNAVTIGYPGIVANGRPVEEPGKLGCGWVGYNFRKAFGCPVKIINDAAMQAVGSYRGRRMLFLGLGTGLGSALILDGLLHPLQLGELPYRQGRCYDDFVGKAALERLGRSQWTRHVLTVVEQLRTALRPDYIVLGGGQASLVKTLPVKTFRGDNAKAFWGGFLLWRPEWADDARKKWRERRGSNP